MKHMMSSLFGGAFGLCLAFSANALPALTFVEPLGVVGPTDVIDIQVRLTADSNGLNFNSDDAQSRESMRIWLNATYGSHYTRLDSFYTSMGIGCAGDTFRPNCGNGELYDFRFASGFYGQRLLSLNAGESMDFLFGTYTPRFGGVPEGTYQLDNLGLYFVFDGSEAFEVEEYDQYGNPTGNTIWADREVRSSYLGFAGTCPSGTGAQNCRFERTVVNGNSNQIPEPTLPVLLLTGIVGMLASWRTKVRR